MTLTPFKTALFRGGDAADSSKKAGSFSDLVASTPWVKTALHVGSEVHFEGGNCFGGNSELSATWSFGDGSDSTSSGVHTYEQAGDYQVRVECRDTAGSMAPAWAFFEVLP